MAWRIHYRTAHSVLRVYFWIDTHRGRKIAEEWLEEKQKKISKTDTRKIENALSYVGVEGHKYIETRGGCYDKQTG